MAIALQHHIRQREGVSKAESSEQCNREITDAMNGRHAEVLAALFKHFGLNQGAQDCWRELAMKLIPRHVPAWDFAEPVKRGRPRKKVSSATYNRLSKLYFGARKPGRPKSSERERWLRQLLEVVVSACREKEYRGRGAATRALREMITSYVVTQNYNGAKVRIPLPEYLDRAKPDIRSQALIRKELAQCQKGLSQAKRLFPEIAAKLLS